MGFSFDSDGHFNIFVTPNQQPYNPYQPPSPTYAKDLKYLSVKYGIKGVIVPMFENNICVGTALVTGDSLRRVSYVIRIDEVDGMRVQLPMSSNNTALSDCNVAATQYGNVKQYRRGL